jgi:HJR/Mrr/RecB family endonuclease
LIYLIWFVFIPYILFTIWVFKKVEKKFIEKDEMIDELKGLLKEKKVEVEKIKNGEQKDFIDRLLESSERYKEKYNKEKRKKQYFENVQKGQEYELKVVEHYKQLGFNIDHRGKRLGRRDGGIDILAAKDNKYLLIQCKNYQNEGSIDHKLIKEFNSNCHDFINNNKQLSLENTEFKFVVPSRKVFKSNAIQYFRNFQNKCRYQIV